MGIPNWTLIVRIYIFAPASSNSRICILFFYYTISVNIFLSPKCRKPALYCHFEPPFSTGQRFPPGKRVNNPTTLCSPPHISARASTRAKHLKYGMPEWVYFTGYALRPFPAVPGFHPRKSHIRERYTHFPGLQILLY